MPDPEVEQPIKHLSPLETYRILMLDDPENIERMTLACKQAGHQVVAVSTIERAMLFLQTKDHVDVVVAAAHLQQESVFEFLKQLRSDDSHLKDVPFVMLCADPGFLATVSSPAVEIAANLMGTDKYLLMLEFDPDLLMQEIVLLLPIVPRKELNP